MKHVILIFLVTIIFQACSSAKKSVEVSASYVPISTYQNMSCSELYDEAESIREKLQKVAVETDDKYDSEKQTEVWSWILFPPAALMMSGNEELQKKLAQSKGQLGAIRSVIEIEKCNLSTTNPSTKDYTPSR